MYRNRETGELKTESQIKADFPNTSFPKPFKAGTAEGAGYDPVFSMPKPEVTLLQSAIRDGTEQDGDRWVEKWIVVDRFKDIPATDESEAVTKKEQETAAINAYKAARQEAIRSDCRTLILAKYPEFRQRNANMGIYTQEYQDGMKAFIQAHISEENRCFALLESANLETALSIKPSWPK